MAAAPGERCHQPEFGFEDFRSLAAAAGVDRAVLVQADDSATWEPQAAKPTFTLGLDA